MALAIVGTLYDWLVYQKVLKSAAKPESEMFNDQSSSNIKILRNIKQNSNFSCLCKSLPGILIVHEWETNSGHEEEAWSSTLSARSSISQYHMGRHGTHIWTAWSVRYAQDKNDRRPLTLETSLSNQNKQHKSCYF